MDHGFVLAGTRQQEGVITLWDSSTSHSVSQPKKISLSYSGFRKEIFINDRPWHNDQFNQYVQILQRESDYLTYQVRLEEMYR